MRKKLPTLSLIFLLLAAAAAIGGYAWLASGLPSPEEIESRMAPPSVRILDRRGRLLYEVLPYGGGRNTVVPLEEIPLALQQATIATEDRSFYINPGVDPVGILRALWINLRGGETLAGGSTLTQQVARNLLLAEERSERTLQRKLREALLAWRLTRRYSKDEILALYLNQTYYGGLAYGVDAAARTFFGKPAVELDLAEAAVIAGLPQAPALYNPFTDPEAAMARQKVVLKLMEDQGYLDPEGRRLAEREKLVFASEPYPMEAPHFVMMVQAEVDRLFTPEEIYQHGGLIVHTTLDLDWQRHAERLIRRQLADLQRSEDGLGHNVNNAALVALDPASGAIRALVGSPDYFDSANAGAVNMALAPRQPGSALKPLVYAAALDPARSQPWTAGTLILDVRTHFVTHEGKAYTPENYDQVEHGPVLLRDALGSSLNIPAVKAMDHIGLQALFDLAVRLGITTLRNPEQYDLSVALGGGEVRLLELTAAYGAFAAGGYRVEPQILVEISDPRGEVLYRPPQTARVRALDERVAWLISDILSDDRARILGFGADSVLKLDRPAAVKTGTTTNFHDNWTVGYTPDLVVGVWVGNTNYAPMREVTGLTGAAPIWHQFMRTALSGAPRRDFRRPDGLEQVEICALSGLLPSPACAYRRLEWYISGTEPHVQDSFYREVELDAASGLLASTTTPAERRVWQTVLDLPPEARPWARAQGLRLYSDLALSSTPSGDLRLLSPAQGSTYYLAGNLPPEAQRIRVEAAGQLDEGELILWVDGEPLARLESAPYSAYWQLTKGRHQAWVELVRPDGSTLRSEVVEFSVR